MHLIAYIIKNDLQSMSQRFFTLIILTGSRSLLNIFTNLLTTGEKRLMINLNAVKACYGKFEINDLTFISSEDSTADALTKVKEKSILKETLHNA